MTQKPTYEELEQKIEKLEKALVKRKQAEKALRDSEERLKIILDSIQVGIAIIDAQTHAIVDVNPNAIKIIGAPKEEIIRHACHKYICPAEKGRCPITDLGQKVDNSEHILLKANGEEVPILKTVTPILLNGKECLLESFIDITEKKKLEAQLQRTQKMEAIGTLAGGVAHDLNNVLGGIVSYPELLLMQLPEDSPLRKPILTIKESGEKAAAIVQDLLTLARKGIAVTEVVNLNDIISDHLKTAKHEKIKSFHPHVQFEIDLEENLLNIVGSPVHLSQTVMNLISNAAESMPDEGKVFISTRNQYIDRPITGYDNVAGRDYMTLSISDEGTGMPEEVVEKIFEPFYTKKVMGRSGTGLGMSVVWGTVKDHNGYIDIQSAEEKGTTITIYFPATIKELIENDTPLSIQEYMDSGETILIVDDVEEQREIASSMLGRLGYTVTTVSSGEEAVEYLKENSADLLLLDMIMDPGIDGLETYRRILKIHPGQKALIVSGFAETERVTEAQKLGAGAYINKPFMLEQIGIAVKHELDPKIRHRFKWISFLEVFAHKNQLSGSVSALL